MINKILQKIIASFGFLLRKVCYLELHTICFVRLKMFHKITKRYISNIPFSFSSSVSNSSSLLQLCNVCIGNIVRYNFRLSRGKTVCHFFKKDVSNLINGACSYHVLMMLHHTLPYHHLCQGLGEKKNFDLRVSLITKNKKVFKSFALKYTYTWKPWPLECFRTDKFSKVVWVRQC